MFKFIRNKRAKNVAATVAALVVVAPVSVFLFSTLLPLSVATATVCQIPLVVGAVASAAVFA